MSSNIKSLALLIAIVSLAVASCASLANGESRDKIPGSVSELGDLDSLDWLKVVRSECKFDYREPDKVFELLKKLDKIYAALDDDAKTNRNEQKIVEQFKINQIDVDQFCTGKNLQQLGELSYCYGARFSQKWDYQASFMSYLFKQEENLAFVCRSYVLENLNKSVGDLDEAHRHDMESTLGDKLVSLKENRERLSPFLLRPKTHGAESEYIKKMSSKWLDILLEFLKEKSGNNLDAKCYITSGDEGREEFNKLFWDSVVSMCSRWIDATEEAIGFQHYDWRQKEDYTKEQASWMKYADVCQDIEINKKWLAKSLYRKLKSEWSLFPNLKLAMNRGFKKMSNSGAKSQ